MSTDPITRVDLDLHINVEELTARQKAAGMRGLRQAAEEIKKRAVEITPKEIGHLRSSAEVTTDEPNDRVYISYSTPYAVYQHERLDLNHLVGEAKFLEKTVNANTELMQQMVAAALRRALAR